MQEVPLHKFVVESASTDVEPKPRGLVCVFGGAAGAVLYHRLPVFEDQDPEDQVRTPAAAAPRLKDG